MPIGRSRVTYNVDRNTQLPHTASIDILRSLLIYLCCERASRGVRIVGVWMASVGIIPRLPSVTNVDHIAVRGSVVKAVQTLGYDYLTKEQLDAVEQAMPATTRPVSCW